MGQGRFPPSSRTLTSSTRRTRADALLRSSGARVKIAKSRLLPRPCDEPSRARLVQENFVVLPLFVFSSALFAVLDLPGPVWRAMSLNPSATTWTPAGRAQRRLRSDSLRGQRASPRSCLYWPLAIFEIEVQLRRASVFARRGVRPHEWKRQSSKGNLPVMEFWPKRPRDGAKAYSIS
jgi:hypothetical protein